MPLRKVEPQITNMTTLVTSNLCQLVHHIPGRVRFRVPFRVTHRDSATVLTAESPTSVPLHPKPSAKQCVSEPFPWETLRTQLAQIPGVTQIRINPAAQSLIIHYQPRHLLIATLETLVVQTLAAGIGSPLAATPVQDLALETSPSHPETATDEGKWSSLKLPATAALLAFLCRFPRLTTLRPLAIVTLLVAAFPVCKRALHSVIVQRRLNIDCLDLLALSLSGWQGRLFTPAMVITLHEFGDVIREQTARSTAVRTTNLLDAIGHFAWVKYDDQTPQQIPSDRVLVGDTVVVYPGEQIPVDGTVMQGEAIVDQQSLTGEAMPVVKQIGDSVLASTLIRSGQLYLRADRVGTQTLAAASISLLQQAPVYDTRMANYAEKIADRLIVPSLLLALLILGATRDPARAAAILTLDFVTGIRVSIPTAFLSALNHTTRHGVLVRSGRTLEQLAEVDTIVFDKTGTLTQGAIAIVGVSTVEGGLSAERVVQLAAGAEQRINHPVAEAIVEYAQQLQLEIPTRDLWTYEVGLGIRAQIQGHEVLVGSERFLKTQGVTGHDLTGVADDVQSIIYVACDGQLQGGIQYRDPLRAESRFLITTLEQTYGIEVHLLTGDQTQRAVQVAQELGIAPHRVYAEAFPEQKAKIVRQLHQAGRTVAFVGDGLNDSVALAYADVSVSFAQGSEIARETADVVLMENQLLDLIEVIAIARQTRDLIDQNTTLVVVPNLLALGFAATVGLNPLVATVIHNGSAIAAGMNSLRPLVQHQMSQNLHQGYHRNP